VTDDVREVLAIQKALAEYCVCIDSGNFEPLTSLFAPDAELHAFGQVWQGADAIVSRLSSGLRGLHLTGTPSIVVDGDQATSRQNFAFLTPDRQVLRMGMYHDELLRREGSWQFTRRRMEFVEPEESTA
jgi:SnoaL-like domain